MTSAAATWGVAPGRRENDGTLRRTRPSLPDQFLLEQRLAFADIDRDAAQDALESFQRVADGEAAAVDAKFANCRFMRRRRAS